jgi:hypothetical protein
MESVNPDIYLFNPTCEYAVGNGQPSWQPNLLLQKMEEDLGALPLYLAQQKDVVLVRKMPSEKFISRMNHLGLTVPEFYPVQEISRDKNFIARPKNSLLPWGWSPSAHRLLEPLKPNCSPEFLESPVAVWKSHYRELYSRKYARELLVALLKLLPPQFMLQEQMLPVICTSVKQIEELQTRWGKIMVKAPWSSSGRGLQPLTKTPVVPKVREKLQGIINDQGYAMAEPYLYKQLDVALQFQLIKGKVQYLGISRFFTDKKGRYEGNYLNGWPSESDSAVVKFAEKMCLLLPGPIAAVIEASELANLYEGNFGIDTLIYTDAEGVVRINPCLELNLRQNMGLLSLRFEKMVVPGKKGIFKIWYHSEKSYLRFVQEMEQRYPPVFNGTRIKSGFFPLLPVDESTIFGAYLFVASDKILFSY